MVRQVRDWWPLLRFPLRGIVAFGWYLPIAAWLMPRLAIGVTVVYGLLFLLALWRRPWRWRLVRELWRSRAHRSGRVTVYHGAGWHTVIELRALVRLCEREMDELAGRFGFSLRRPLVVVLAHGSGLVSHLRGRPCSGFAVIPWNAIVVASPHRSMRELVRHELVHLFAGRWGLQVPALFSEGLAVWLQGTEAGAAIDDAAQPHFRHRGLRLPVMLKESFFRDPCREHACYLLAGSFTGFLIRRFGWRAYRRFYRAVAGWGGFYRWVFRRQFGLTLEQAEWQWRNELLVPEPIRRRMRSIV
jgi:hypothetical protein